MNGNPAKKTGMSETYKPVSEQREHELWEALSRVERSSGNPSSKAEMLKLRILTRIADALEGIRDNMPKNPR